ncbi:MAG: mannosyltransferase family protein [Acidimicrobiales bacterium]
MTTVAQPPVLELAQPASPAALGDRWVVRRYFTIAAVLTAVVAIAPHLFLHPYKSGRLHVFADSVLGGWLRWDGWWYVTIAEHGYSYRPGHMSSVAFFPAYPLVLRVVGAVLPGGVALAAVVVTLACGALDLVLFHRWCARRMSAEAARAAVGALGLYPFAWFLYGAAYSDAMFLGLVLAAFLLVEDDRPLAAGLVAFVATATRPTGITLVIGLVAVTLDRRGLLRRAPRGSLRRRDLGVLLSIGGLIAWCAWLAIRFGNAFAFVETEGAPGWNQPPGLRTWLKLGLIRHLGIVATPEAIAILLQTAAFIGFLCAVRAVSRRLGRGYAVYTLSATLIPAISTRDFLGVGRYLLVVFPVFALVGLATSQPSKVRSFAAAASASLLVAGAALFSAGYLVA